MLENDLIGIFIRPLNLLAAQYMITGSVAATIYGEPRLTHDIDLVIEVTNDLLDRFEEAFPATTFSLPPREVLGVEAARPIRGHCNIIHFDSGLKADLYFVGKDPLHRWAMDDRRRVVLSNQTVWIAPPEYVILRKLLFFKEGGSEKHLRDIKLIVCHSNEQISTEMLEEKIESLGLFKEWKLANDFKV